MTREQSKIVRNLQYLEKIERKKQMSRLIDPMGMPVGGNSQPQPGPGLNAGHPVLQLLWPVFAQSIHDQIMEAHVLPLPDEAPGQIVDKAWEIANRAFERMGFQFMFPMAARLIPPAELHESDREHAQAAEAAAAATEKEGPTDAS